MDRAVARIPSASNLAASGRGRALLRVGAFAFAVALERRRVAKGSRERVRRVDARTGAPPSLRQTIVVLGARDAIRWLFDRVIPRPGAARRRAEAERVREIEHARAQHADDPSAQQEAIMEVIRREPRVGPASFALPAIIRSVALMAVNRCPVPLLAERRTLADLLAGTKLVRSRPSRWARLRIRRPRRRAAPRSAD